MKLNRFPRKHLFCKSFKFQINNNRLSEHSFVLLRCRILKEQVSNWSSIYVPLQYKYLKCSEYN